MKKALKAILLSCATILVVMFVLSLLGVIDNFHGNSFGFSDKTAYTSFILIVLLSYVIVTDGYFSWFGELSLIVLDVYMLWLHSRTAFVLILVLTVALLVRHLRRAGGVPYQDKESYGVLSYIFRMIYLPIKGISFLASKMRFLKKPLMNLMCFSFLIVAGINYSLIFLYRLFRPFWSSYPFFKTFADRLKFSILAIQEYPITLFGTDITLRGSYGNTYSSLYFIIDSAYVRLPLIMGVIPVVIAAVYFTILLIWTRKKGYGVILLTVSLYAIDLAMDYSVFGLLLFAVLIPSVIRLTDKPSVDECDRFTFRKLSKGRRWTVGIAAVVVLILFSIFGVTAYQMTNRIDHEPRYGATLVIPREVLGDGEDVLIKAYVYLFVHGDSFCIVDSESDRDTLISLGIEGDRIFIQEFSDIDDMLVSASEIIDSNGLPNRLTVCSYSSRVERLRRHAARLHIPFNSLSMKQGRGYLSSFFSEQWRLICEG